MTEAHTPAGRALLARIAAMFHRLDPVPPHVQADAEAAGLFPDTPPTARCLPLIRDTAIEPLALALRSGIGGRLLSFGDLGITLRVELSGDLSDMDTSGGLRLTGLLTTEGSCTRVSVCWPAGEAGAPVDALQRFEIGGVPPGPMRLRMWRDDQLLAVTPWFNG